MRNSIEKYLNYLSHDSFVIYLFHGVIKENNFQIRNYNQKHLKKDFFQNLMKRLSNTGNPVSMDDITKAYEQKKELPPKSFAITFDDGFENNLTVAAPILAGLSIPATFYITSGFIDHNRMSWIDQIEYAIELTNEKSIKLSFLEGHYSLQEAADKIALLNAIRSAVKNNIALFNKVDLLIAEIFEKAKTPYVNSFHSVLDQKMSWNQVKELDAYPLFNLGAHTETHPIMSFLPEEDLEREIQLPIQKLEENLGKKITHFSYPEGLAHCFNNNVISKLKDHGIRSCPTAIHGTNDYKIDLFHLKRITVV